MQHDMFRLLLTPEVNAPGTWSAEILECSLPPLIGPQGSVTPVLSRQELDELRNNALWPNQGKLTTYGQHTFQSFMNANVKAAFTNCLVAARNQGKGLRLVVSVVGGETNGNAAGVQMPELPFELFHDANEFPARNPATPVSRSLKAAPTYKPKKIALPLRVLVVTATPNDLPASDMTKEREVVTRALQNMEQSGAVECEFCDPPTKKEFLSRMEKRSFHVVHFIGHGKFDTVGDDPTPVPYVCFEADDGSSDPADSELLAGNLVNSDVRLVVFSACATAKAGPDGKKADTSRPLRGLAQRLIAGPMAIPAVVAMQFDFESKAAVAFTEKFYEWLLHPEVPLDEAVTRARVAVVNALQQGTGHRAWATPALFWNCFGAPLFEIDRIVGALDAATEAQVKDIQNQANATRRLVEMMNARPPGEQPALQAMREQLLAQIEDLDRQRGQLLGDSIRLIGDSGKPGTNVDLALDMRLRTAATIGNIDFRVRFDSTKLSFVQSLAAAGSAVAPFAQVEPDGRLHVVVPNASGGQQWNIGEHHLGAIRFGIAANATGILDLKVENTIVQYNGANAQFAALDSLVFVDVE